jgi:hypothetical protein
MEHPQGKQNKRQKYSPHAILKSSSIRLMGASSSGPGMITIYTIKYPIKWILHFFAIAL